MTEPKSVELIAICRYVEELHPEPNLFGATPLERATVEMWQRRVELHLMLPIAQVMRHSHPHMAQMEDPQIPDWAAANRPRALRNMLIFDGVLSDRPFIAGDRFTVADITGLVALDFTRPARIAIPAELGNLNRWFAELEGSTQRGGLTAGSIRSKPPLWDGGFDRQGQGSTADAHATAPPATAGVRVVAVDRSGKPVDRRGDVDAAHRMAAAVGPARPSGPAAVCDRGHARRRIAERGTALR